MFKINLYNPMFTNIVFTFLSVPSSPQHPRKFEVTHLFNLDEELQLFPATHAQML
jgi:hypothetical protein